MGRPEISSCSLAYATRLPVNVTAPISRLSWMVMDVSIGKATPNSSDFRNSAPPTSSDAPPPRPLSSATIWGIAVIFTARASQRPSPEPTTSPATITP